MSLLWSLHHSRSAPSQSPLPIYFLFEVIDQYFINVSHQHGGDDGQVACCCCCCGQACPLCCCCALQLFDHINVSSFTPPANFGVLHKNNCCTGFTQLPATNSVHARTLHSSAIPSQQQHPTPTLLNFVTTLCNILSHALLAGQQQHEARTNPPHMTRLLLMSITNRKCTSPFCMRFMASLT